MHHTENMTIEQTITEMPETPGRGGYLCCCACLVWEDFETPCRVGGDFVFLFFCSLYLIVRRPFFLESPFQEQSKFATFLNSYPLAPIDDWNSLSHSDKASSKSGRIPMSSRM